MVLSNHRSRFRLGKFLQCEPIENERFTAICLDQTQFRAPGGIVVHFF
jgi:hypothetical protein